MPRRTLEEGTDISAVASNLMMMRLASIANAEHPSARW
jgi:hypothetical protein